MLQQAKATPGDFLDSLGRWFLATFDYRVWGLIIVGILVFFALWRRLRYKIWPAREDYLQLLLSLLGCIGGAAAPVAFLLTKPPAIEMLSGPLLLLLGLGVPILVFGNAIPRLKALFLPPEVSKPPKP